MAVGLLLRLTDKPRSADPDIDRASAYYRGDVVDVREDGRWFSRMECPPDFGFLIISDATGKRLRPLSSAELLAWAGRAGRLARIEQAAQSGSGEPSSIAKAALRLISRDGTELDLNLPDRAGMLDALVAAGVLTAEEKADLCTLATQRISPAQAAGLGEVYEGHVTKARAQHG